MAQRIRLVWPERGTYVLVLRLTRPSSMKVGSLGNTRFKTGYYTYVGSARKGMRSRLSRHLARVKKKRWHVDWLTTSSDVVPVAVGTTEAVGLECKIAGLLSLRAQTRAKGFGCSDCDCESHLLYFSTARALDLAHDELRKLGVSWSTP